MEVEKYLVLIEKLGMEAKKRNLDVSRLYQNSLPVFLKMCSEEIWKDYI